MYEFFSFRILCFVFKIGLSILYVMGEKVNPITILREGVVPLEWGGVDMGESNTGTPSCHLNHGDKDNAVKWSQQSRRKTLRPTSLSEVQKQSQCYYKLRHGRVRTCHGKLEHRTLRFLSWSIRGSS